MSSTRLGYLAVNPESTTTPTITPVKPTKFLRFKGGDFNSNKTILPNDPIQNNRRKALEPVPTTESVEGEYQFDLDANEAVHWLRAALGGFSSSDVSSGTDASVIKHTITVAKTLPLLTVEQAQGDTADTTNHRQNLQVKRAYGVSVNSFTLSATDSIINLAVNLMAHGLFEIANLLADASSGSSVALSVDRVKWLIATTDTVNIYDETPQSETDAIASISTTAKTITIATLGNSYTVANKAKVELVAQTPSYSVDPQTLAFHHCTFQFGADLSAAASAAAEVIEDWTLTYNNNLDQRYGSGSPAPSVLAPRGANAQLSFTKYFQTAADRDRFLRAAKQACIITIENANVVSATDTGNLKYKVVVKINKLVYTSHDMPTANDEVFAVQLEGECFYDSSDGAAFSMEVTNERAGTHYTSTS